MSSTAVPLQIKRVKMIKALLIVVSIIFCHTRATPSEDNRVENALDRVLTYIFDNHHAINIDGLFGVVFVQGQLHSILESELTTNDRIRMQRLKTKADLIYAVIKPQLYNGDEKQITFVEEIIDPTLWQRKIEFRHGVITPTAPIVMGAAGGGGVESYDGYMAYLSSSNMSETQSDECMLQLIASGSRTYRHECRLSDICRLRMVEDPHFDPTYGITHRLLYLQIGRARLCAMNPEWYGEQTQKYCSYILWEATKNANFGFLEVLDDILLEQMTLCGYEGFEEFFTAEFIEHVLDAQTAHGCYGIPMLRGSEAARPMRRRRSANLITYGCNDHTTGLGASTLALILRYHKTK